MRNKLAILLLYVTWCKMLAAQPLDIGKWPGDKKLIFFNDRVLTLQSDTMPALSSLPNLFGENLGFSEFRESIVYANYNTKYYAHRFIVCNSSPHEKEVICLFGGRAIRLAWIGQYHAGKWKRIMQSGYTVPFEKRPFQFVRYGFPIRVAPSSCDTFYLSLDETAGFRVVGFIMAKPETRNSWLNTYYISMGWILGLLTISLLLNIFLFFSLKEKVNGWYSLYLIFAIAFVIKFEGLEAEFLGLDSAAGFYYTPMTFFSNMSLAFLVKTMVVFTPFLPEWAVWRKTGNIIFLTIFSITSFIYLAQVGGLFHRFPQMPHPILIFCSISSITYVMLLCLKLSLKKVSGAIIILIGLTVVLMGAMLRTFLVDGDFDVMPPFLFEKGLALEAIIISFGLMYRYNLFKKEKETLALSLQQQEMESTRQLIETLESEQERVARDLHDELSGNLAALQVHVHASTLDDVPKNHLMHILKEAADSARRIAHNLMPPGIENTGLRKLLTSYFNQLPQASGVQFHFFYAADAPEPNARQSLMVYRMVLELVNNILKHSQATEASIQINVQDATFRLLAEDNGIGIPHGALTGMGLRNMQTRVKYLGGTVEIDSSSKGTSVLISFPME